MQPILRLHYLKISFLLSYSSKQENKKKGQLQSLSLSPVSAPLPKLFSEATLTKARRIELPVKQKQKQPPPPNKPQTKEKCRGIQPSGSCLKTNCPPKSRNTVCFLSVHWLMNPTFLKVEKLLCVAAAHFHFSASSFKGHSSHLGYCALALGTYLKAPT